MSLRRYLFIFLLIWFSSPALSEQLIIEPDMGRTPIIQAIQTARSSIQLVMYGLTDQVLLNAIIAEKNKHLTVMLEKTPYRAPNENTFAISYLKNQGVLVIPPNPIFTFTHQKSFTFDHKKALIMTFNLTHGTFLNERNVGILIDDETISHEIEQAFYADQTRTAFTPTHAQLAWCPNNCRAKITSLIQEARHSIRIYAQQLTDYRITGLLANAARRGVHVQLLLSASGKQHPYQKRLDFLRRAGVLVHFNQRYVIHAKVIMIDDHKALIGSINLTEASLNNNRELGIITTDRPTLRLLLQTFQQDWVE